MNTTVPAGALDPAGPPASHEGLEALLEILPHRLQGSCPGLWCSSLVAGEPACAPFTAL